MSLPKSSLDSSMEMALKKMSDTLDRDMYVDGPFDSILSNSPPDERLFRKRMRAAGVAKEASERAIMEMREAGIFKDYLSWKRSPFWGGTKIQEPIQYSDLAEIDSHLKDPKE